MSDVTVLGLGLMGAAIANTFQKSSIPLTVWNRSHHKAKMLEADNLAAVETVREALLASPISIICVNDPRSVFTLFDNSQIAPLLEGKTIIQLSTCLPQQTRDAEGWLTGKKAAFLSGAIHCGPQDLGSNEGQILVSGAESTFQFVAHLLSHLGGKIQYLGENIAAASALDLAWLSTRFGRFMGMLHASNICVSEGVDIEKLMSLFPDDLQVQHHVGTIRDSSYDTRSATLAVWQASLELVRQQAQDARINSDFPDLVGELFKKASEAGYGNEHVMSLFKVLRNRA